MLATLGAEGLGYLFGQRAHHPRVEAFRGFWLGTVEPALATRQAGAVAKAPAKPEVPPAAEGEPAREPPQASREDDGGLRARFGELAQWLWKHRDGRPTHVQLPNYAAILARLWQEADGAWLAIGAKTGFARSVGLSTGQSAEQGLGHLRRWGLVEARPDEADWPEAIRLDRAAVEAALREIGEDTP